MPGLIVHEWIEKTGGAEKVLDAMLDLHPEADLFCLWNDNPSKYQTRPPRESWLARTPLRRNKPMAAAIAPLVWRNVQAVKHYDWVLVSSHLFAHQIRLGGASRDAPKFVYVHTPARYVWEPRLDPRGSGLTARMASALLKPLDKKAAQSLQAVAANSEFVKKRIFDTWGIDSKVIYPPVEVARISGTPSWAATLNEEDSRKLENLPSSFILGASRFVPYKRLDEVIKIGEAADIPVVLAGSGPDQARLNHIAATSKVPVFFVRNPSDPLLFALYQATLAFVFPAVEDFGIMPVEAMAAGAPVLVNALGGTSETVINGLTGVHLREFDSRAAVQALESVDHMDRASIKKRASDFSREEFDRNLKNWMSEPASSTEN